MDTNIINFSEEEVHKYNLTWKWPKLRPCSRLTFIIVAGTTNYGLTAWRRWWPQLRQLLWIIPLARRVLKACSWATTSHHKWVPTFYCFLLICFPSICHQSRRHYGFTWIGIGNNVTSDDCWCGWIITAIICTYTKDFVEFIWYGLKVIY